MSKFHSLTVSDVTRETADSVSIALAVPDALKNDYQFRQGQYVTLKLNIGGEELRRSYSICSSPYTDQELRVAVKRVKDGKCSTFLNEKIKPGDLIDVMVPAGNFFSELQPSNKKNYVLFAGGSGITPMMSIIKSVLHVEPESTLTLIYGNLNEDAVIFKKQLAQIEAQHQHRFSVYHVFDKPLGETAPLFKGMMTQEKVKALITKFVDLKKDNVFFICGPTGMMDSVKSVLGELKVDPHRVHIEYFAASPDATKKEKAILPDVQSEVTVIIDGIETSFMLSSRGKSVLDAAMEAGADAPFSCKGAVCCTCKAKVVDGRVHMDLNYALSEEEVKAGYILTCQSHPLTPKVLIDYDTR